MTCVVNMASSGQCLTKAEECARLTGYVETPQLRVARSNAERTWLKLADQCRRLEELEILDSPDTAPAMDSADRADADRADLHD